MHVRRNWDENLRQTEPFIGKTISAEGFTGLSRYVKDFLERNDGLIDCREKAGWVRECHGDLHAEHVVMTEPIRIYDCIEFNRRFRVSDILADIAFLLMDMDRHGRPELSQILWQEYHKALPDEVPEELLRFYKIYRACVRGKVASFLSAEHEAGSDQHADAVKEAFSYFSLALGYLQPRTLIITCGLMGSGKTSLAMELAVALRAELIRSDIIRLEYKDSPGEGAKNPFLKGPYSTAVTARVYKDMADQAEKLLQAGRTVILDAGFGKRAEREVMRKLAAKCNVRFSLLLCESPRELALSRLEKRRLEGKDVSDGRVELYDLQSESFELPLPDEHALIVDTSLNPAYAANTVLGRLLTFNH
jgi:predicted kinase